MNTPSGGRDDAKASRSSLKGALRPRVSPRLSPALLSVWEDGGVFITRSSYSSSTSRSSRRSRRWWGCFPYCGALGGHWQLLPDEPASVSYASPPALSPWTGGGGGGGGGGRERPQWERWRRRKRRRRVWGGIHWKIITALSWSTTHKHEEIQDRGGSERKREALSIHSWIDYWQTYHLRWGQLLCSLNR